MKKITLNIISCFFSFLLPLLSEAATVNVSTTQGVLWTVADVEVWDTTGSDMDKMTVTINYNDQDNNSHSATAIWQSASEASGANGVWWSLEMLPKSGNGDASALSTFDKAYWLFSNNSTMYNITSLTIDGKLGNTVFDIKDEYHFESYDSGSQILVFDELTPKSWRGNAFTLISDTLSLSSISASYTNEVAVLGQAPYGDLYQTLTLNFTAFGKGSLTFAADTDNVRPVPEPATLLMFGMGLVGAAAVRSRKNNFSIKYSYSRERKIDS